MSSIEARKQAKGVSPRSGVAPPKKNQFGQPGGNPRNNGAWKKEDTPRYKLEQMMKLTESELTDVIEDTNAPQFERKLAVSIQKGDWKTVESMINQVYGQPKQTVQAEVTAPKPLVDLTKRKKNGTS